MKTYPHTENLYTNIYIYIHIYIAALFIIAKKWKQPNCPSTAGQVKCGMCIHTMEYYLAIKNVLIHATTWHLVQHET